MKQFSVMALVSASLLATPVLAGPPIKLPYCQVPKNPARDVRREPCRKPPIPPVVDRTPMFLVSTSAGRLASVTDLT